MAEKLETASESGVGLTPLLVGKLMEGLVSDNWIPVSAEVAGNRPESQIIDGHWCLPKWGCDTLQRMVDFVRELERMG